MATKEEEDEAALSLIGEAITVANNASCESDDEEVYIMAAGFILATIECKIQRGLLSRELWDTVVRQTSRLHEDICPAPKPDGSVN